jgi:hypothetical protein
MREIKGLLKDVLRGGLGQPPRQEVQLIQGLEQLKVLRESLAPFGVEISAKGVGALPIAAPPAPQLPKQSSLEQRIAQKVQARIEKELDETLGNVFDPKEKEPEPEPREEKPESDFEVVEVPGGVMWPGTNEPVRYARDRETGKVHAVGTGFANPHFTEKFGGKLINIFEQIAVAIRQGVAGQSKQASREEIQGEVVDRRGLGAGIRVNGEGQEQEPPVESQPQEEEIPPPPPLRTSKDDDMSA